MQITLRQLKVFIKVSELLSYTKAAEQLYMSQPAVSKQIKHLEEQVGMVLFEQVGKKIFLTEAGHELKKYAEAILNQVAEAKAHLIEMRGGYSGSLKVAVATTASSFAIDMLGQFRQLYPEVDIEFEVTNRQTLLQNLENNLVDFVIMGVPPENHQFQAEPFMDNPLVFIAPNNHKLVGRKVSIEELSKEPLVVREEGSGTRQAMEKFFQSKQCSFNIGTLFNSNDSIKSAVISGLGVGLVSVHTIQSELEYNKLTILDVEGAPIKRSWYLVQHKDKRLSLIAETFQKFIVENAVLK